MYSTAALTADKQSAVYSIHNIDLFQSLVSSQMQMISALILTVSCVGIYCICLSLPLSVSAVYSQQTLQMPQKTNSTSPRGTRWLKLSVKLMGPVEVRDHFFLFASVPTLNRRKARFSENVRYSAKLPNGLCNFRSVDVKRTLNRVKFPRRLNTGLFIIDLRDQMTTQI